MSCALKNLLPEDQNKEIGTEASEPIEVVKDSQYDNKDVSAEKASDKDASNVSDIDKTSKQKEKSRRKPKKNKTAKEQTENCEIM